MDTERPTLDIARELRDVAKPGGFLAELLTEAAARLEHLQEVLHPKDVQIARPWPHPEAFDITPGVSCCCVEVEGDEFCPVHCCTDHDNLCGVANSKRDACCDNCPEFV